MIIFFPLLLFFFIIIFLPENKGNPVSKVPDASYSPCPENVIIQFPCHWADFIVLGGISILPPLFLLKLLNVLYRSNYKTRLDEYEKETKNGVRKTFMGVKTLSTMNIMFFFSPRILILNSSAFGTMPNSKMVWNCG